MGFDTGDNIPVNVIERRVERIIEVPDYVLTPIEKFVPVETPYEKFVPVDKKYTKYVPEEETYKKFVPVEAQYEKFVPVDTPQVKYVTTEEKQTKYVTEKEYQTKYINDEVKQTKYITEEQKCILPVLVPKEYEVPDIKFKKRVVEEAVVQHYDIDVAKIHYKCQHCGFEI